MNSESNENFDADDESLSAYSAPAPHDSENEIDDLVEADLVKIRTRKLSWSGKIAWVLIVVATCFMFFRIAYDQVTTAPQVGGDATSKDLMPVQLNAKGLVGQRNFLESQGQPIPEPAQTVPDELDSGSYEQRLCYAIMVNEVEGSDKAAEYLDKLEKKVESNNLELTESQEKMRDALSSMIQEYDDGNFEPEVDPTDRKLIEDRLEWVGELAFVPPGSPDEAARQKVVSQTNSVLMASIGGLAIGGFFGLLGIGLVIMFFALLMSRKLKSRFSNRSYDHNIYIETFAIWMFLFFGSGFVFSFIEIKSATTGMLIQPFVFFGSLIVLAWPVFRGISFADVRADIGWTSGNSIKEMASAFPTYFATLPFLLPGVILLTVLMSLITGFHDSNEFARPVMPGHPVQDYISAGGVPLILLVFITACVAAPIVEETMFRGVLYRHLRDATAGWKRFVSVVFSALINGLIFASIHPQGIYGIPVLATLAIGFSLTREWRGSLIAPMMMHFIHNFAITCVSLLIL